MFSTSQKFIILSALLFFGTFFSLQTNASTTNGTIDSTYKYAWGSKTGWVNFGCDNCSVAITDAGLTGYAWSVNYGWINLNPTNGGVKNTSAGVLSGYAWGENLGWIDFDGVTINSSGVFTGTAVGDNIGTLNFDCANCAVKTDWRPASTRGSTPVLDNTDHNTQASGGVFLNNAPPISAPAPETVKPIVSEPSVPPVAAGTSPSGKSAPPSVLEKITKYLKKIIPGLLKPPNAAPPAIVVSRRAPLSMRGGRAYLPEPEIRRFVFAPLPKETIVLAKNFPQVEKTFKELGVRRMTDLVNVKMSGVKFNLPGLTVAAGLSVPKLGLIGFGKPGGAVPLVKIGASAKKKIPSEIIFARAGAELIDYNMSLTVDSAGRPEQKITTIVNKPMHLAVRPQGKVKSVKGFLVFRSRGRSVSAAGGNLWRKTFGMETADAAEIDFVNKFIQSIPLGSAINSLFFAGPSLAKEQEKPVRSEEKLVLLEFEYTDPDGDGVYTADIQSPAVDGEYEIITVMTYVDPALGARELRLITVVDPEGYVYEKYGDKEIRIPGAIASLYWYNPAARQYELWPAKEYQQENPQVTDVTGRYSYLVPPGAYYIKVEAPGYLPHQGAAFDVEEGRGVHFNVELKTKYWWLKFADWKTIVLVLISLGLLYNFYKDRKRSREG